MKPIVSALNAWNCVIISLFAIVILSILGSLYRSNHHAFTGSEGDPEDGAAVAGSIFTAVIVYAGFLIFCGFQAFLHTRSSRRGAITLNWIIVVRVTFHMERDRWNLSKRTMKHLGATRNESKASPRRIWERYQPLLIFVLCMGITRIRAGRGSCMNISLSPYNSEQCALALGIAFHLPPFPFFPWVSFLLGNE